MRGKLRQTSQFLEHNEKSKFSKFLSSIVGRPNQTRRRIYIGPNISIVMLLLYIQYMKKRDVIHSESGRDILQGDYVA